MTDGSAFSFAKERWETDGWCLIESALVGEVLGGSQHALTKMFPTAEEMARDPEGERATPWRTWDASWPEFPFRSRSLNRLILHDKILDLVESFLRTDDVRLYLGLVTAKYAGQPSNFNKLLHTDYPNHTVVVPRRDAGYQHLELLIYLSDVTLGNGATHLVPRSKTAGIPVERHTLSVEEYGHLYEDEAIAVAKAGSILAYRPDIFHRSVDFADPKESRFILHAAFKPAPLEWVGYQAWPIKGYAPEWYTFVNEATPRQLAALGFPRPGHPYWTAETLSGVAARYPDLDLAPWKAIS